MPSVTKNAGSTSEFVSWTEATQLTGASYWTLRRALLGKAVKVGRRYVLRRADVIAWAANRCEP